MPPAIDDIIFKILMRDVAITFPKDLKGHEVRVKEKDTSLTIDFFGSGNKISAWYNGMLSKNSGGDLLFYNTLGLLIEEFAIMHLENSSDFRISVDSEEEVHKREYPFHNLRRLVNFPFSRPDLTKVEIESEGMLGGIAVVGCDNKYIRSTVATSKNFYKDEAWNKLESLRLKSSRKKFSKSFRTDEAVLVNDEDKFVHSSAYHDVVKYLKRSKSNIKKALGLKARDVDEFLYNLMFLRAGYDPQISGAKKKCAIGIPNDAILVGDTDHILSHVRDGVLRKKAFIAKAEVKEQEFLDKLITEGYVLTCNEGNHYVAAVLNYDFNMEAAKALAHGSRDIDEAKDLITISGARIVYPRMMYKGSIEKSGQVEKGEENKK